MWTRTKVDASIAVDDVRRQYYDSLDGAQAWWWIRSMQLDPNELIVDDDEGSLYRVPFTIKGDGVTFGDATEVAIVYQDKTVAASAAKETVVFATKDESRPVILSNKQAQEKKSMTPEQLKAINLPDEATDEQITARLAELVEGQIADVSEGDPDLPDLTNDAPGVADLTDPVVAEQTPATPAEPEATSFEVPEGHVLVNAAAFEQLKVSAQRADSLWEASQLKERDDVIVAAMSEGKFAPAQRKHYESVWASNPKVARDLISSLPANTVPVKATGRGDDVNASIEDDAYPTEFLTPVEREQINARKGL